MNSEFENHFLLPSAVGGTVLSSVAAMNSVGPTAIEISTGLGLVTGPLLWKGAREIYPFLATHPVPQGIINGINIALGNGSTVGGMNRVDTAIDEFLDRY